MIAAIKGKLIRSTPVQAVVETAGGLFYEVEIPWNAVGIDQPERLKQFRMSLIVNDCDNGKTRENSILVSDGVMGNKEVKRIDTFPVVDLIPRR